MGKYLKSHIDGGGYGTGDGTANIPFLISNSGYDFGGIAIQYRVCISYRKSALVSVDGANCESESSVPSVFSRRMKSSDSERPMLAFSISIWPWNRCSNMSVSLVVITRQ